MPSLTEEEGEGEVILQDLMSRHWTFLGDAPTSWTFDSSIVAWTDSRAIITGGSQMGKIQAIQDSIFVYNKETTDIETLPTMIQARAQVE